MEISTSVVAAGKVQQVHEKDQKIPLGWNLDKNGLPSTDPSQLWGQSPNTTGKLLRLGSHKGYGLALLLELFGGVLTGCGCAYLPDHILGNGTFIIRH